ncbi:Peptidoglycan/LPS O-acetylase OafA/YrhL, contains acyltransferase and SGNH-hydrolase domains [Pseudobutyrivibrio sp. YE44]|uniref:acyltransferase family protein n=1 Tax=Pseudobutyrivibrio sp. YE44 TaxID=1520802 RepID=UPI00088FF70A|nr:acyltransferase [Pseudobutyrivibrio sp. YE44]SDB53402.1 Peptidoglycan/LPS O-acetylase OafA/YrhL, contains acyltransferase and SGNH-hydrolase domains [Pseudobutyrivibrio sp. YE44]
MNDKYTLGALSQGRNNNLNLVRLVASFMVMYMHSLALSIAAQQKDIMYTLTFHKALSGQVAVDIFFIISGFLIYQSYDRSRNIWKFLKARFLRIWPLLALFILSTAFIIGPMLTTLSREEYFAAGLKDYLLNLVFASSYTRLPEVFFTHIEFSVNGSIWTLRYEVICYLLVLFFLPIFSRKKNLVGVFLAASAAVYLYFTYVFVGDHFYMLPTSILVNLGRLTMQFEMGILFYLNRNEIPMKFKYFLIAVVGLIAGSYFFDYEIVFAIFGTYIVLYIGFSDWKISRWYDKVGDLSYGVYVLSFLVQQLVIEWIGVSPDGYAYLRMDPYVNLAISTVIVLPLAYISWHCFEKQLLKLK